jgi:hypothetical protein
LFCLPPAGRFFRILLFLGVFVFWTLPFAPAQEDALDWDFDTLFDEQEEVPPGPVEGGMGPEGETGPENGAGPEGGMGPGSGSGGGGPATITEDSGSLLAGLLRRSGFSLDLSYSANGGFSPGWSEAPWFAAEHKPEYSHVIGANLNSYLGLDVRISESFRAQSSLSFSVPGASPALSVFFIDYTLLNRVYFRVGKFSHNWGISPNFPAANLLSRLPQGNSGGDPYILKVDIPIGIGGLQVLALTRPGFMQGTSPGFREIGYGGKYNLAFTWADIDAGVFYYQDMPLRASLSVKTTIKDTELYFETMGVIQHGSWVGLGFSANLGFVRSFFNDRFSANAEIFWNGEDDAYYFKPRTELEEENASPFIPGFNAAWNLIYRPRWIWNLRFALTGRWAVQRTGALNTAYILPGLSFAPLPHINVSVGVPIALGGRDGGYYRSNADTRGRPLALVLLVNLQGGYRLDRF